VLADSRGRRDDGVIVTRKAHDKSGERLGDGMRIKCVIGDDDLLHAIKLCGGFGHGIAALTGNEHDDIATKLRGGSDGLCGCVAQRAVVVVCNNKRGHPITPASLSVDTSSAAVSTLIPA